LVVWGLGADGLRYKHERVKHDHDGEAEHDGQGAADYED